MHGSLTRESVPRSFLREILVIFELAHFAGMTTYLSFSFLALLFFRHIVHLLLFISHLDARSLFIRLRLPNLATRSRFLVVRRFSHASALAIHIYSLVLIQSHYVYRSLTVPPVFPWLQTLIGFDFFASSLSLISRLLLRNLYEPSIFVTLVAMYTDEMLLHRSVDHQILLRSQRQMLEI